MDSENEMEEMGIIFKQFNNLQREREREATRDRRPKLLLFFFPRWWVDGETHNSKRPREGIVGGEGRGR